MPIWSNVKFCAKLKKTKQEATEILKKAYGDEQMSKTSFYRWFNKIFKGSEQVEDKPRLEAPKSAH